MSTFEVFTIFPAAIEAFVHAGIMGKAIERELVTVHCTNLREFAHDRHRTVDDSPFGGGAGMVIKAEPVVAAIEAVVAERGPMHTILLTPSGRRFDQRVAERLATVPRIALLCGRYEGIDDRVREHWVDECLSIGDFVLNGGEVAAAVVIEAVARLREGVLGNPESIAHESFAAHDDDGPWSAGLVLEHPHYTRPAEFRGHAVPGVLLAGDHEAVARWRRRSACMRTWQLRPELRPRWSLPSDHPIWLAVGSESAALVPELEQLGAQLRLNIRAVAIGPRHMRDLKQAIRELRKRHGQTPWLIGVGEVEPGAPERRPRPILDVLAFEHQQLPPPLLLWLGGPEHAALHARPPLAWLALGPDQREPTISTHRLALASALIDIAQPQAARQGAVSLAHLAHLVLGAMRRDGLLGP